MPNKTINAALWALGGLELVKGAASMNENLKFILILAAVIAWGAFIPIFDQMLIMDIKGVLFLSFIVPLALIGLSICLWRARQPGIAGLLGALALTLFWASAPSNGSVNLLIDWVRGETTPQAKVAAYLEAIARSDEEAALAMWIGQRRLGSEYEERRHAITRELMSLGGDLSYRILDVEWWRTCCEPGVIEDPREAGFARLRVAVGDAFYIFDVLARYHWWEDHYRAWGWRIVDVYHEGEAHLAWPYPLPTPPPAPPPRKLIVEDVAIRMRPGVIELEGRIDLPPGTELMAVLQRDGKDWYWADPDTRLTAVGEDGHFVFTIRAASDQPDTLPPANYLAFIFPTDPALGPFIPARVEWDTHSPPSEG